MAVWVIADLHLAHSVNKPMDRFGSRWRGHTEKLTKRWSALVGEDDTVVIPGDISWGMNMAEAEADLRFIDALPGKKKLLGRGNHDYWWTSASKLKTFFASSGIKTLDLLHNNAHLAEDVIVVGSRGWYIEPRLQNTPMPTDYEKLVARECLRLGISFDEGERLREEAPEARTAVFLHFPPVFGDFVCRPIVEVLKQRGARDCYFGHIHGVYDIPSVFEYEGINMHLISADMLDFYPALVCLSAQTAVSGQ